MTHVRTERTIHFVVVVVTLVRESISGNATMPMQDVVDGNVIMSDDVIVANGSVAMADVAIVIAADWMIPMFVNRRIESDCDLGDWDE